ncbi:E3 ubiquitin-protein ligase TRIM39-like [Xiphophorus maculatus]|uniref:E3 ubiquitin-protein ligase TRIM39-like n=1 Tax=Xiphophorus maculatus TaxID=8083 RepID=A0A3B5RCS4_XIPMA|nr:E3 ubiquitin-protein ligase TRIM39-like [Xiphophorus maculatus]
MASVSYSEELTCSVCLTIFTDPVNLPCGHSFCRQCISEVLVTQQHCPHCGAAVALEAASLPTSLVLKSLAEKAKAKPDEGKRLTAEVDGLCPEHEEKLKLFCITDQQLVCIICRDGEEHEGHQFKPVKEAAASLRKQLEMFEQCTADDIHAVERLADAQKDEMFKTRERSQRLLARISKQFEEMHQFLRRRENEIKSELKHKEEDNVEKMRETFQATAVALSESRELKEKVSTVLKITESESFLKSWTEGKSKGALEHVFRPRVNELQVVESSLSLGPYESHLQFFMWKEMLQVIQPWAALLTLKRDSEDVVVSDDGRSLFCKPKTPQVFGYSKSQSTYFDTVIERQYLHHLSAFGASPSFPFHGSSYYSQNPSEAFLGFSACGAEATVDLQSASSVREFRAGQHYWEIEVGSRNYWELGVMRNLLKYDGVKYAICGPNVTTDLEFGNRPRKIGVYFNCSSKELSFYDADTMTHIHSVSAVGVTTPVSAQINIQHKEPDHSPVTVCWY